MTEKVESSHFEMFGAMLKSFTDGREIITMTPWNKKEPTPKELLLDNNHFLYIFLEYI